LELDSYVDLNLKGGYVFTDRLTAFTKINNVLSTNYQPFHNYDVQGIQVLAGIIYKFDF
jgi:outer membrane cobalamin receptor